MIWRKMHAGLRYTETALNSRRHKVKYNFLMSSFCWIIIQSFFRGLRYPDVSFKYEGGDGGTDEKCRMPTKTVGPYIVVDTIPGRCQMYVLLLLSNNIKHSPINMIQQTCFINISFFFFFMTSFVAWKYNAFYLALHLFSIRKASKGSFFIINRREVYKDVTLRVLYWQKDIHFIAFVYCRCNKTFKDIPLYKGVEQFPPEQYMSLIFVV